MAKLEHRRFEILADMLVEVLNKCDNMLKISVDDVAQLIIDMCKRENPRFDEDRFHAYVIRKFADSVVDRQNNDVVFAAENYLKRIK